MIVRRDKKEEGMTEKKRKEKRGGKEERGDKEREKKVSGKKKKGGFVPCVIIGTMFTQGKGEDSVNCYTRWKGEAEGD